MPTLCLACLENHRSPSQVVCKSCYRDQAEVIAETKDAAYSHTQVRKKLWGQRYGKNQNARNRTRIAYAAWLLAQGGDTQILDETTSALIRQRDGNAEPDRPDADAEETRATEVGRRISALDEALGETSAREKALAIPTLKTMDGHLVRSEPERALANWFFMNHIRYKYETALHLGAQTFLPDFQLPDYGGLIIEYFGMLDRDHYRAKAEAKAQAYKELGIEWIALQKKDVEDLDFSLKRRLETYEGRGERHSSVEVARR